jgi:pilus assembly protein CpaB
MDLRGNRFLARVSVAAAVPALVLRLLVGLFFGIRTFWGPTKNRLPQVAVLVAKQNLPMATHITDPEKLFEEKQFTKGEEPRKAIRDFAQLKGKYLNKPLSAEQFVTPDDVDDKGGDLVDRLPPGPRAVGIKVAAEDVAGGFVQPQCRVDIISVIQRNENETYVKVVLQNILVLAVDQMAARPEDKMAMVKERAKTATQGKKPAKEEEEKPAKQSIPSTVTVEVTQEQAEKLGLAIQLGRIKLALRATEDLIVPTRGITPKGILQRDVQIGDDEPYAGGI